MALIIAAGQLAQEAQRQVRDDALNELHSKRVREDSWNQSNKEHAGYYNYMAIAQIATSVATAALAFSSLYVPDSYKDPLKTLAQSLASNKDLSTMFLQPGLTRVKHGEEMNQTRFQDANRSEQKAKELAENIQRSALEWIAAAGRATAAS